MAVQTLGNNRQQNQANKGATWAIAVIFAVILVFVAVGFNNRYNRMKTEMSYVNP